MHVGKRAPPPFQGPRLNRGRRAAAERRRRPAPRGSLTRGPEDAELRAERFRVADVRFCTLPARLAALGFISRLLLKLGAASAPAWWRVGRRRLIEAHESSQSAPWVIDLKAPRQRQTPGPVLALPQGDGRSGAEGRAVSCDQQGRPGSSCVPRPPPRGCGAHASHLAPRPRGPVAGSGERDGGQCGAGGLPAPAVFPDSLSVEWSRAAAPRSGRASPEPRGNAALPRAREKSLNLRRPSFFLSRELSDDL